MVGSLDIGVHVMMISVRQLESKTEVGNPDPEKEDSVPFREHQAARFGSAVLVLQP